jgi:hypothetical protein
MRNAKNPARSYLHQAYLHVRHLSHQDRLSSAPDQARTTTASALNITAGPEVD